MLRVNFCFYNRLDFTIDAVSLGYFKATVGV